MSRADKGKMHCQKLFTVVQHGNLDDFIESTTRMGDVEYKIIIHSKSGDNLLHAAAMWGKCDILKYLHEKCKLDLEQCNFDGKRPLHEACQFGNISCIEYIISQGASVDCLKKADWTPLMLACTKNSLDVVKRILDAGADPTLVNKDGWNSFHIACREGHMHIVNELLNRDPFIWDTISNNGRTTLHTTALHGKTDALNLLLSRCRYRVDVKDTCGTTPLMDAIRSGHLDCADLLITKHKADVNTCDMMGRQCLHLAAQAGCEEAVQILINKYHVNVNVQSPISGVTPLHVACKENQHAMVEKLLVKYKANSNLTDNKGRTALHIASGCQFRDCVGLLLHHGARDTPDQNGIHARDMAVKKVVKDLFTS